MRRGTDLVRSEDGAVAPLVAITLFGLVAIGAVGFDYARIAGLDSEMQNAADQATLAAATQLDGNPGTRDRAIAAAHELIGNLTFFGNDGASAGTSIEIDEVVFYVTEQSALADNGSDNSRCPTAGQATGDFDANYVCVRTVARTANFALTPIVSRSSGTVSAMAVAGLAASICKTPPVMICNPEEDIASTPKQLDFDANAYIGHGLRLVSVGGGPGFWEPGNFGYLDSHGGSSGAPGLREALGWNTPPGNCLPQSGVDTKPGATVSVTDAINTRFDIIEGTNACPTGGSCAASINSTKDVRRPLDASGGNACKLHNQGWSLPATPYFPTSDSGLPSTLTPSAMGHPRDTCHYRWEFDDTMGCEEPIGDGNWDRDAYFRTNYNGATNAQWRAAIATYLSLDLTIPAEAALVADVSRKDVYEWEIANRGTAFNGQTILGPRGAGSPANAPTSYGLPVCSSSFIPSDTVPDRRRISVAVVNCKTLNVNGNETNLAVLKWLDVFLVEPSMNRGMPGTLMDGTSGSGGNYTTAGDVYVEIVGETQAGGSPTQVVRRDVPYLLK